jgi:hypothetical protein
MEAVVKALAAVVHDAALMVLAVVTKGDGSGWFRKKVIIYFASPSNGHLRVRDSYKASIASYES